MKHGLRLTVIFFLSISLSHATGSFAEHNPDSLYDVFPLQKGLTKKYDYYGGSLYSNTGYIFSWKSDSGIVAFTVTDSSRINDSTVVWKIVEKDSLWHREFNIISPQPKIDTSYRVVRQVEFLLQEKIIALHELTVSSPIPIWSFPWEWIASNYIQSKRLLVNRYSNTKNFVWVDSFQDFYRFKDSLCFLDQQGLVKLTSVRGYGFITWTGTFQYATLRDQNITSVAQSNEEIKQFALHQNYPNPFNPQTKISFSLSKYSLVSLKVYDLVGREVKVLVNGSMNAGNHSIIFDASGLTSGVYFYTLFTGQYILTKKMILLR